jgi:hypothetical protein
MVDGASAAGESGGAASRSTRGPTIEKYLLPGLILFIVLVLGVVMLLVTRERHRIARFGDDMELPPLIFPVHHGDDKVRPAGMERAPTPPPYTAPYATPPAPPPYGGVSYGVPYATPYGTPYGVPQQPPPGGYYGSNGRNTPPSSIDAPMDGSTVRFQRPLDEAVQLLPGRLEVTEGADRGQDIRFFRIAGEIPAVTIGRGDGAPYRHVTLRAPTVSRTHARMLYEDGRWKISNLSETNPVVVNGQELSNRDGGRWLADGDRIEIGEVVLRFHERAGDHG